MAKRGDSLSYYIYRLMERERLHVVYQVPGISDARFEDRLFVVYNVHAYTLGRQLCDTTAKCKM